ncbi:MAG: hypothetical protein KF819_28830 [Labilithrix sp.]|nr:hypothetical protein [Labilithrix sp.]
MNPAQQQIVAQWNQYLQQMGGHVQGLMGQAGPGCEQLIGQNPTDPIPLNNALGAIEHQVKDLRSKLGDAFSEHYDRICDAGEGEPGHCHMKRAMRGFERWMDETWMRFDAHIHVQQYRAMWPHVQAAMQKPTACNRCGGPLQRQTPHKSESINCPACRTVNQVMPESVVAQYYGGMPHYYAQQTVIDKFMVLQKFKDDWEDYRDAEYAADRERPDMPMDRLKHREQLERDYWTAYAETRVQNEGGTPDDVRTLVDARMKQSFYDEMNLNDVWRQAHGMQGVAQQATVPAHLQNVDEWGPLNPHQNPNALEDNYVHEQLLNEALREPDRHAQLITTLGYRDATHRAMVHATFRRHYDDYLTGPEGQQLVTRAAMRAMNERMKYMTAAGAAGGLLDPIEGVSIAVYGNLQVKQASVSGDAWTSLLAQHQMDQPKWERVAKGWLDRMTRDTTGVVATEYAKAFAGQGQYGSMGAAAADNMASGQMGLQGPQVGGGGGEPMSFEKYCEIGGAMQAWSKQGKDVSAGLHKYFQMTAMDFSNVSMYWSQKMMADLSMFDRQNQLQEHYEQKYAQLP